MGDVISMFGIGGGASASTRKASLTDLQKMKMVGGEAAKKEIKVYAWRKGVGERIKTKDGYISADDMRADIIQSIRKAGVAGYKGKQLEKKLYKEMGVERSTRRRIMNELGKKYVKLDGPTLTPEQIKRNVKIGHTMDSLRGMKGMYKGVAAKLSESRSKEDIKKKFESTDSSRIGAKQAEYKNTIFGNKQSEGDFRGAGFSKSQGEEELPFSLSSTEKTAGVAGDFGVPKDGKNDTIQMFKRFGQSDSYNINKAA